MTMTSVPTGEAAESLVSAHLEKRGWQIVGRRVRVGKLEVDLLARHRDIVAVVEVRGRRIDALVPALDTIDWQKQRNLARAARSLWSRRFAKDQTLRVIRIDVAAVTWTPEGGAVEIIEGAVDPELR